MRLLHRIWAAFLWLLSPAQQLDSLLVVLQARGVSEYRQGRTHIVLRDPGVAYVPFSKVDAVLAGRRGEVGSHGPNAPFGDREKTDDQLLYGEDGYGLGVVG